MADHGADLRARALSMPPSAAVPAAPTASLAIHAIAPRGGWDKDGVWVPMSYVDTDKAEQLFRYKVFVFLKDEGLLSEERIKLLMSWRHSGFSVHNGVTIAADDRQGLERLARYIMRPPVSLERLSWDDGDEEVVLTRKGNGQADPKERVDALEFLARVLTQICEPKLHYVRFYGEYSNAARGKRRKSEGNIGESDLEGQSDSQEEDELNSARHRAQRRRWALLIKRVYEQDPLVCPSCGSEMRVISVILDPKVIDKILSHLKTKGITPGRSPPHESANS